mgnify:CR=1 FL=1
MEFIRYKTPLERFLPKHRAGFNAGVPSPHDRTELDALPWRMDVASGCLWVQPKGGPGLVESRGAVFMVHPHYRGKGGGWQVRGRPRAGAGRRATRTLREGRKGSPPVYGGPGKCGELWVTITIRGANRDAESRKLKITMNNLNKCNVRFASYLIVWLKLFATLFMYLLLAIINVSSPSCGSRAIPSIPCSFRMESYRIRRNSLSAFLCSRPGNQCCRSRISKSNPLLYSNSLCTAVLFSSPPRRLRFLLSIPYS